MLLPLLWSVTTNGSPLLPAAAAAAESVAAADASCVWRLSVRMSVLICLESAATFWSSALPWAGGGGRLMHEQQWVPLVILWVSSLSAVCSMFCRRDHVGV
jgi:hypothetical protein